MGGVEGGTLSLFGAGYCEDLQRGAGACLRLLAAPNGQSARLHVRIGAFYFRACNGVHGALQQLQLGLYVQHDWIRTTTMSAPSYPKHSVRILADVSMKSTLRNDNSE